MPFSVQHAAQDLMMEPEDLQEIFAVFFEDTPLLLEQGKLAWKNTDWLQLSRNMHAIKGAASNLRMNTLGELAARAEKGEHLSPQQLQDLLEELETELHKIERVYQDYLLSKA